MPNGELPPGIHRAGWDEIITRYGIAPQRLRLLAGFLEAALLFKAVGSRWILLNGSFVSSKHQPNDIDACYDDQIDLDHLHSLRVSALGFRHAASAAFTKPARRPPFHTRFAGARF
jgi:hypothetical protein